MDGWRIRLIQIGIQLLIFAFVIVIVGVLTFLGAEPCVGSGCGGG